MGDLLKNREGEIKMGRENILGIWIINMSRFIIRGEIIYPSLGFFLLNKAL